MSSSSEVTAVERRNGMRVGPDGLTWRERERVVVAARKAERQPDVDRIIAAHGLPLRKDGSVNGQSGGWSEAAAVEVAYLAGAYAIEPWIGSVNKSWMMQCLNCGCVAGVQLNALLQGQSSCDACGRRITAEKKITANWADLLAGPDADWLTGYVMAPHYSKALAARGMEQMHVQYVCPLGTAGEMRSADWKNGHRCPCCAESGFKPDKPATLYLHTRKIGRRTVVMWGKTNDAGRLALHARNGWQLHSAWSADDGYEIDGFERSLNKAAAELGITPGSAQAAMDRYYLSRKDVDGAAYESAWSSSLRLNKRAFKFTDPCDLALLADLGSLLRGVTEY